MNVGRYLRGEDQHVGTARTSKPFRESDIERHLVKRVKELGGEVRKVQWVGRVGAPDRLVMMGCSEEMYSNGYRPVTWVELKAPGAKPRPSQLREHERMRSMGQRVVVIDSIEGVEELLR